MSRLLLLLIGGLLVGAPARGEAPLPSLARWSAARSLQAARSADEQGQRADARRLAEASTSLDPTLADAWRYRTELALRAGDATLAQQAAEAWVALSPTDSSARWTLGVLHLDAGRVVEARGQFEGIDPRDPASALGRALLAARVDRDWTAVESDLRQARVLAPGIDLSALPMLAAWQPIAAERDFLEALTRVLKEPAAK